MSQKLKMYSESIKLHTVPLERLLFKDDELLIEVDDILEKRWQILMRPYLFRYTYEDYMISGKILIPNELFVKAKNTLDGKMLKRGIYEIENSTWMAETRKAVLAKEHMEHLNKCVHLSINLTNSLLEVICPPDIKISEMKQIS